LQPRDAVTAVLMSDVEEPMREVYRWPRLAEGVWKRVLWAHCSTAHRPRQVSAIHQSYGSVLVGPVRIK